jgi:hypothetical protein
VPDEAVSQVVDLVELRRFVEENGVPDLLILVQTWSDEFAFSELLGLPGIGPLSRMLCVYGPWCISDGRNRQNFPLALRLPLEDLRPALRCEWGQLVGQVPPAAPLPWTAGRDEVFAARCEWGLFSA